MQHFGLGDPKNDSENDSRNVQSRQTERKRS